VGSSYSCIDLSLSITTLNPKPKTSVYYQSIFMADFRCPECNICFVASHQRDGHHRSVHRPIYRIRTATGRIIVNRSIDDKYPCPVDSCRSTFERNDMFQRHFKGRHVEQSNFALNQHLDDDAQIRAMSLGMLIEPPIE
jgi:hypothetical protein